MILSHFFRSIWILLFFLAGPSRAEQWSNPFIQFELPANWQCSRDGGEYVCQNKDLAKKREAIIILAAKVAGNNDSLSDYEDYLRKERIYVDPFRRKITPKSAFVKRSKQSSTGLEWVDALQSDSEIFGFKTRYLATVKRENNKTDMAVLVTFSVRNDRYQSYLNDIQTLWQSVVLFHPDNLSAGGSADLSQPQDNVTSPLFSRNSEVLKQAFAPLEDRVDNRVIPTKDLGSLGLLILALIGVIIYVLRKRRKKKQPW